MPLGRSCTADLVRQNRVASTKRPSAVGLKPRRIAVTRWTEAVHKTVDCLSGPVRLKLQKDCRLIARLRWVEADERL